MTTHYNRLATIDLSISYPSSSSCLSLTILYSSNPSRMVFVLQLVYRSTTLWRGGRVLRTELLHTICVAADSVKNTLKEEGCSEKLSNQVFIQPYVLYRASSTQRWEASKQKNKKKITTRKVQKRKIQKIVPKESQTFQISKLQSRA